MVAEDRPRSTSPRPATLRDHQEAGFGLTPTCRACWHEGRVYAPVELAATFGLPMSSQHPAVERLLRCTRCGARKGYLAIRNPDVTLRT